ncbi:MAG: DUF871 domain-containing protein [Firmicutes bacterium]|nr:DUF871 domain-containing protein [Bacillota bacterium]
MSKVARKIDLGISVYPEANDRFCEQKNYIALAKLQGYSQIFSTLHLPELPLESMLEYARNLSSVVTEHQMQLTLDVSATKVREIAQAESYINKIKDTSIDYIRLDYGFTEHDLKLLKDCLNVNGLVLNASTLSASEIDDFLEIITKAGFDMRNLKACHNFYPREETGLSMEFLIQKCQLYKKYNIPVTTCIASHTKPRGPLYAGLPSVEKQRYSSPGRAAAELMATGVVDEILFGDSFVSAEELSEVAAVIDSGCVELRIKMLSNKITEMERAIIVEQLHLARPDQAEFSIRSQSSREMASFAARVEARSPEPRIKYAVTIDNEKYLRYSGELQILLADLPEDERINVVGHIVSEDHDLVHMIKPGTTFRFQVVDE